MSTIDALFAKLSHVKRSGSGWLARCPAHDDSRASLSIAEGDDGRALAHCHAGCTGEAICQAIGLRVVDLIPTASMLPLSSKPKSRNQEVIVAQYEYRDEQGDLLFQVVRIEPKDFR